MRIDLEACSKEGIGGSSLAMVMEGALVTCAPRGSLHHIPLPVAERRIMHYSSLQKILLVGEGDFSFSNSLASAFGDGRNIFATSLDSQESVLMKYKEAAAFTLSNLKRLGTLLFHQVDATCMAAQSIFRSLVFDCIVYNFPHAGFHGAEDDKKMIKQHKQLVRLFFENAVKLLRPDGEVHVSHKVSPPYTKWKLEKQAVKSGLMLRAACDFQQADYPGYVNRRGDGSDSAGSFHLGRSKTFIFYIQSAPFNPWRQLSHVLGRRPLDFFHNVPASRKPVAVPAVLPRSGALSLPRQILGPCIPGLQRASLKRRMDEEEEELQAVKRGCFRFRHPWYRIQQIAPPRMQQLERMMPCERRMIAPALPSPLFLGSHQGGMHRVNPIRPLPMHAPGRQHPLLPLFR